jgi:hypothetical protein
VRITPEHCECQGWVGRWPYHGRTDPVGVFRCSDCDRVLAEEYVPASELRRAVDRIGELEAALADASEELDNAGCQVAASRAHRAVARRHALGRQ